MAKKVNKARPWSYRVPVHLEQRLEAIADVSGLSVGKWTEALVVARLQEGEALQEPTTTMLYTDWRDAQLPPGDRHDPGFVDETPDMRHETPEEGVSWTNGTTTTDTGPGATRTLEHPGDRTNNPLLRGEGSLIEHDSGETAGRPRSAERRSPEDKVDDVHLLDGPRQPGLGGPSGEDRGHRQPSEPTDVDSDRQPVEIPGGSDVSGPHGAGSETLGGIRPPELVGGEDERRMVQVDGRTDHRGDPPAPVREPGSRNRPDDAPRTARDAQEAEPGVGIDPVADLSAVDGITPEQARQARIDALRSELT